MYIPRAFSQQTQFSAEVAKAVSGQGPRVLSVTPTFGEDMDGESAVFLQVVVNDDGVSPVELLRITRAISWAIVQQVQPLEQWGVLPYFDFHMQASRQADSEPALA